MSQGKITEKQKEILEYIKETILGKGYPPAVREICEAVHLKSTSSVHSHLEALERNGYIRRDPTKPRTIEILDDDFALTRREVVNVPIIGSVKDASNMNSGRPEKSMAAVATVSSIMTISLPYLSMPRLSPSAFRTPLPRASAVSSTVW